MDPTDSRADALLEVNTPCSEVDTTTSTSMGHPPPPRHPPKQSVGFDSLRVVAIDEPNKLSKASQAASGSMIYMAIQKRAFVKALYSGAMSTNSVRKQTHKPSGEFDSCLADNTPRNTLNDITGKARCQRPKESSVSVCYK
jgi:hypothetical protein